MQESPTLDDPDTTPRTMRWVVAACLAVILCGLASATSTADEQPLAIETHSIGPAIAESHPPSRPPFSDRSHWLDIADTDTLTADSLARLQTTTSGLAFPRLTTMSDDLAALLARFRGDIALDSLTEIRPRVAWMLVTPPESGLPRLLCLNGLSSIDEGVATALSAHRGGLSLDGITCLDISTARLICRTEGVLSMRGLETMSLPVAVCLSNRTRVTLLPDAQFFTPEVRDILADNPLCRFGDSLPAIRRSLPFDGDKQ